MRQQGAKMNSKASRTRTSNNRSTTTVEVVSAREVLAVRCSARIRATSPARAGRTLLKHWPSSVASKTGPYGGRVAAVNRNCQRSARTTCARKSSAIDGIVHQ